MFFHLLKSKIRKEDVKNLKQDKIINLGVDTLRLNFDSIEVDSDRDSTVLVASVATVDIQRDSLMIFHPMLSTEIGAYYIVCNKDSVVIVVLTPQSDGGFATTLWIWSNNPNERPAVEELQGVNLTSDIAIEPAILDGGIVCPDSMLYIPLLSIDYATLQVDSLVFSNPVLSTDQHVNFLPTMIEAGSTICVRLTFVPGREDTLIEGGRQDHCFLLTFVIEREYNDAAPNDTVTIPLKITDAKGITGAEIALPFNPNILTNLKVYQNEGGSFADIATARYREKVTGWPSRDRNDAGGFTDIATTPARVYVSSVAWGDYDNDGDLDILLAVSTGSCNISKVYRNDAGNFVDSAIALRCISWISGAWGDYDNDGDLDILLTGDTGSGYIAKVYRNDAGSFVDIAAALTEVAFSSLAWNDYGNNGDFKRYELYHSTTLSRPPQPLVAIKNQNAISYAATTIEGQRTYTYWLNTVDTEAYQVSGNNWVTLPQGVAKIPSNPAHLSVVVTKQAESRTKVKFPDYEVKRFVLSSTRWFFQKHLQSVSTLRATSAFLTATLRVLQVIRSNNVKPSQIVMSKYHFVEGAGWRTKPMFEQPLTSIRSDSTWTIDITAGDSDIIRPEFKAFF